MPACAARRAFFRRWRRQTIPTTRGRAASMTPTCWSWGWRECIRTVGGVCGWAVALAGGRKVQGRAASTTPTCSPWGFEG
eukprot:327035-Chlamydomonas_euryale.AAC.1